MSVKICSLLLVSFVIISDCIADPLGNTITEDTKFHPEDPCSRRGGICGLENFCPAGRLYEKGLCPAQQNKGVECCGAIPLNVRSCSGRGGICRPTSQCNPRVQDSLGRCPPTEVCCILVN